jgi:hypothetical protein
VARLHHLRSHRPRGDPRPPATLSKVGSSFVRCKTCHYSLANLTEHRCPECGTPFDPNDPASFLVAGSDRTPWTNGLLIAGTIALLVGVVAACVSPTMPTFNKIMLVCCAALILMMGWSKRLLSRSPHTLR